VYVRWKKRGRPRGTFGPRRAECLRRFDAGGTVAEIARAVGISKQAVSVHLRASGRDPAAAKGQALRAGWRQFRDAWNAAPDLGRPRRP
jgi:hypothetical protein